MDQFPSIKPGQQRTIAIELHPFLFDHTIQTGAVLPAVQSMQVLCALATGGRASSSGHIIDQARFGKLLHLPADQQQIDALIEADDTSDGSLRLSLLTKAVSKSGITRRLQHASLTYLTEVDVPFPPIEHPGKAFTLEVPPEEIYQDLVSFGPFFRNLAAPVKINEHGAETMVSGGTAVPPPHVLGSPFALDSAFHAACAWGKAQTGRICYPVAFKRRQVILPAQPGQHYSVYIRFKAQEGSALIYDLGMYNTEGEPADLIWELVMKEMGH